MAEELLFALGTYTTLGGPGIRIFSLEGNEFRVHADTYAEDPIYLLRDRGEAYLYAVCGGEGPQEGWAASFAPKDGDWKNGLEALDRRMCGAVCPCHLCIADGDLITGEYADGCISVFPLENGRVGERKQLIRHTGHGAHPVRQTCAHVHQVLPFGADFLCMEHGEDRIIRYTKRNGEWTEKSEVRLAPGKAPRHGLVYGYRLYVVTELGSTLQVYDISGSEWTLMQELSLPTAVPEINFPAALRLLPDGKGLCASNRGADKISFFAFDGDGSLIRRGEADVRGHWPRDILPLADGRVLVTNQKTGNVALLGRDRKDCWALLANMQVSAPVALLQLK